MESMSWLEGADPHAKFQLDLSCMMDGELDETAATRAMIHIEECSQCRDFFDDIRDHLRLHRDMGDPDRLFARVAMLTGAESLSGLDASQEAHAVDLVNRLSTVFYQLGKAYVLSAIDPDFRTRVFEQAVPLEETRRHGRGFIDGVLLSEQGGARVDWEHARSMLNGRLESIEDPLAKGRRLLEEAVAADPSHEESRLYLAFLSAHEGQSLLAVEEYREVFDTAISEENRGHAAAQLGKLYISQRLYRKALVPCRWATLSGLTRRDERFFFVRFNIGMDYAFLGDRDRSVAAFRDLLDHHPARRDEVVGLFERSDRLRESIENEPEFVDHLLTTCPELFEEPDGAVATEGSQS